MIALALGLVVWTLAGAATAIPLCLILKRSDQPRLLTDHDAKQDGAELSGGERSNFINHGSASK